MKKINLLMIALIGAMTLTLTSCDDCKDVTCENGGTCAEGVCACATNFFGDACEVECVNGTYADGTCGCTDGYEGDACEILSRDRFIASFAVAEVCGSGNDNYTATISASNSDVETILISNFYNTFTNPVIATVNGSEFTIANQEPDNDGYRVSGTGSINDSETQITISFSVAFIGTAPDNCTSTYVKQ